MGHTSIRGERQDTACRIIIVNQIRWVLRSISLVAKGGRDDHYGSGSYVNHMQTDQKHIRIDRRDICYLQAILDAYDGLVSMTTVDAEMGVVQLFIAPGQQAVIDAILVDLSQGGMMMEKHQF
jgi:hypothetical protein